MFTSKFPELNVRIQNYVHEKYGLEVVRCCIPKYRIKDFEEKMPEGFLRESWCSLPDSKVFDKDDEVYSICHNCSNIIEEMRGVPVTSLYELIDSDGSFPFPDFSGMRAAVQDCWRAKDRQPEQEAVRSLLKKMHIEYAETEENHENTRFCGLSLYRPQPDRNPKLAPAHYLYGAEGLFQEHTEEEQIRLMKEYCAGLPVKTAVCYCHYCLEGLKAGGAEAYHIADLLFRGI